MAKPARRLSVFLAAIAAFVLATLTGPAQAASLYNQPRYAAIVVDAATGEVLYARRADQPRYPASISKVMTMYLTFEALATGRLKLDDRVVMSANGARQPPSKLGLRAGQSISVDEAVRTMALLSANDVAVAMAEKIGGSESRFAAMMTLRAHELGMSNSRFVNPHGLPDTRQISTARDIAILSRAIMRDYPQYYSYFGQRTYSIQGRQLTNHNGLLRTMPGVDGIKTGFTNASGYNLAASAVRDGRRLIAVVLGGSSTTARNQNVMELLNAGFEVMDQRRNGQAITIASTLHEPDDVSGPVLADGAIQLAAADTATKSAGVTLTGAVPAAAITPGSFSSAWLKPAAFDPPRTAAEPSGLKAATLALAVEDVSCDPVRVVRNKVVKSKARKGRKARSRTVQVVTWERPKACGPAPQAMVAKASLTKPTEADSLSSPERAIQPERIRPAQTAAVESKCMSEKAARSRVARQIRAACLKNEAKAAKKTELASAKPALKGSQTNEKTVVAKGDGGAYAIQVGAYKSRTDAKSQLDKISKQFGSVVASADSLVQTAGSTYRARFKGFSASQAKAACETISAKGEHCMVLAAS